MTRTTLKYWLSGAALAAPFASALAEGEASTPTFDKAAMDSAVKSLQDAATDTIASVKPAIITVLVALFVIVGIGFAWKYIRKFIGR